MSPEFLKRAERIQASSDPDTATGQTVAVMSEQIHRSAADPLVMRAAFDAVNQYRGGPFFAISGGDPFSQPGAIAESAFWWAKHRIRFVHHSRLILVWLNERDQLQLLIEPAVLVRMRAMAGDCAIYSMLVCAFLEVFGIPWEVVTLAVDRHQPSIYSHVFARAILPGGQRLNLDASHGLYAGWMVPGRDIFRSQVWNSAGNPVDDSPSFEGLHDYVPAHRMNWRGLGQVDDTGVDMESSVDETPVDYNSYDQSTGLVIGPFPISTSEVPTSSLGSSTLPAGAITVPSQSSASWANAVTALAKAGLTLAEINAIQPGTVVGANGQILRQSTGYPVGTSASISTSGSSLLLYAGLGLVAVLLIGGMKR